MNYNPYIDKIWKTKWKYLIILDACRYDYFERVYRRYLPMRVLEKVHSCATVTREWLKKVFGNRDCKDIVYISANPYINSKGISVNGKFNPRELHFYKIMLLNYIQIGDSLYITCNLITHI